MTLTLRLILSIPFLIIATAFALLNLKITAEYYFRGKRESMVFLATTMFGIVGLSILGRSALLDWWWVPLIVDVGCFLLIPGAVRVLILLFNRYVS